MHEPITDHCSECNDHSHQPGAIRHELLNHLPFSVSSVAIGLAIAGVIGYLTPEGHPVVPSADEHGHDLPSSMVLFHLFHPVHVFFSAATTTAMFWRYERTLVKSAVIGLVGSIGVCGFSDIIFPQFALMIMGQKTPWHVCVIEHPGLVLPFALVGIAVGLGAAAGVSRSTLFSHSLHVLASTLASIFYLVAHLDLFDWVSRIGQVFVFMIAAVMLPCCVSDIMFPLLMSTREAREKAMAHHHHEMVHRH